MNTTHLIFNGRQINCTILGGRHPDVKPQLSVSVILLNSGNSHLRFQNLEGLTRCGFEKIISVENDSKNYNIEDFVQKFPHVKFIIPLEKASDGDLINLAQAEISSPYFLVLRDSLNIGPNLLTTALSERLFEQKAFCLVPRLLSMNGQSVPVQFIPSVKRSVLKVDSSTQVSDSLPTLYPFNFIGLYDCEKFRELGGYDSSIQSAYWQNLDLSVRAWLWGEKIKIGTAFQISYSGGIPVEDSTPDLGQLRFFLKNMAPVFKDGRAELPLGKFFSYKARSSCGIFESARQFSSAREWVRENKYSFKMDAVKLICEWGSL